jgi:hypothetical protein
MDSTSSATNANPEDDHDSVSISKESERSDEEPVHRAAEGSPRTMEQHPLLLAERDDRLRRQSCDVNSPPPDTANQPIAQLRPQKRKAVDDPSSSDEGRPAKRARLGNMNSSRDAGYDGDVKKDSDSDADAGTEPARRKDPVVYRICLRPYDPELAAYEDAIDDPNDAHGFFPWPQN